MLDAIESVSCELKSHLCVDRSPETMSDAIDSISHEFARTIGSMSSFSSRHSNLIVWKDAESLSAQKFWNKNKVRKCDEKRLLYGRGMDMGRSTERYKVKRWLVNLHTVSRKKLSLVA